MLDNSDVNVFLNFFKMVANSLDEIRFPFVGFTSYSMWDFLIGFFLASVVIFFVRLLFGLSTSVGGVTSGLQRSVNSYRRQQGHLQRGQMVVDRKTGTIIRERK